ncbi:hypothetical protein HI914_04503 [Erysiphe necator]|nr:hypothetical protein HI914_04503 [Erysiphe necator]
MTFDDDFKELSDSNDYSYGIINEMQSNKDNLTVRLFWIYQRLRPLCFFNDVLLDVKDEF